MNKFETKTPPNLLEFRHTSIANEWVMRITADRRIEVNEGVEVTDAAKKVLEAMQHLLTPERKPLTDEERMEMWRTTKFRGNGGQLDWFIAGTRAAEAAHGIKE